MPISEQIRYLRENAGFTQNELAQKLFVTRQAVSMWERGVRTPDIETCARMAKVFEVEPSFFFSESDTPTVTSRVSFAPSGWFLSAGIVCCTVIYFLIRPIIQTYQARNYQILPGQIFLWSIVPSSFWLLGKLAALALECKFGIVSNQAVLMKRRRMGLVLSVICAMTPFRLSLALIFASLEPLQRYSLWFLASLSDISKIVLLKLLPFMGGYLLKK